MLVLKQYVDGIHTEAGNPVYTYRIGSTLIDSGPKIKVARRADYKVLVRPDKKEQDRNKFINAPSRRSRWERTSASKTMALRVTRVRLVRPSHHTQPSAPVTQSKLFCVQRRFTLYLFLLNDACVDDLPGRTKSCCSMQQSQH
jgi:hypothetical protein